MAACTAPARFRRALPLGTISSFGGEVQLHFTVVCRRVWGINGFGGMERGAEGVARGLAARGHTVEVVTSEPDEGFQRPDSLPFDLTLLPPRQRQGIRGWLDYRPFMNAVAAYLPSVRTDMVIGFYGDLARTDQLRAPRVLFTYGLEWLITPGLHGLGLKLSYGPYQREGMRRAEYLATCGSVHLLQMYRQCAFTGEPFQTQNWTLQDSSLHPSREEARLALGVPENAVVVSTLSRLALDKKVHVPVEAVHRVRARSPQVQMLVAGDGPERSRVMAAAAGDPGIRFLGQVDDATARLVLRASDTSINVARSQYQMFAVIEPLGLGTPVACAYADRMEGIIQDGVTGFVLPKPDVPSVERAVERLLAMTPERRRAMEVASSAVVGDSYKLEYVARQFEELVLDHQRRREAVA